MLSQAIRIFFLAKYCLRCPKGCKRLRLMPGQTPQNNSFDRILPDTRLQAGSYQGFAFDGDQGRFMQTNRVVIAVLFDNGTQRSRVFVPNAHHRHTHSLIDEKGIERRPAPFLSSFYQGHQFYLESSKNSSVELAHKLRIAVAVNHYLEASQLIS